MVRSVVRSEAVRSEAPKTLSNMSKLKLVTSPQLPDNSPVAGFSMPRFVLNELAIYYSYAALSVQDGVCDGVTSPQIVVTPATDTQFGVCDGITSVYTRTIAVFPVAVTPVGKTPIDNGKVIVPVLSSAVPETPVRDRREVPVTPSSPKLVVATAPTPITLAPALVCSSPRAEVPETPVTEKRAVPVRVKFPTAPVAATPVGTCRTVPAGVTAPAEAVAETPVTVIGMAWFQAPSPQVPLPHPDTVTASLR
tara:strand:- start:36 stop:788 length:753 start_codon:yes stop_codon:yes gene_type:complete